MEFNWKKTQDFLTRTLLILAIMLIPLYFMDPGKEEIRTTLIAIYFEGLALLLCNIGQYVFTKLDFIKNKYSNDRPILGYIFIGVHFLLGVIVLGVYIAQFAPPM